MPAKTRAMAALERDTPHADADELYPRVQHLFGTTVSVYSKILGNKAVMDILNGVHLPQNGHANRILLMLAGRVDIKTGSKPQSVSRSVQAQGAHPSLLRLPIELREIVYGYALDDKSSGIAMHDSTRFPKVVPSWCFANKQIYAEAQPVFVREKSRIVGREPEFLSVYLLSVPNNPFLCLRNLCISRDLTSNRVSKNATSQLHFLLREATALRELVVQVSARDICVIDLDACVTDMTTKSEEHLVAQLQPSAWFQSEKLEILWLEVYSDRLFAPSRYGDDELGSEELVDICYGLKSLVERVMETRPGVELEWCYLLDEVYNECEMYQTGYVEY